MANLTVPELSTEQFTWCKGTRSFVSEASDLRDFRPSRLYDDACDEGFALKSSRTGHVTRWALQGPNRDGEGDVTCWVAIPTPETVRKYPSLRDVTVVILND